jgi:enterochelin esterase-like enzyme
MEPNSILLVILLLLAAGGSMYLLATNRHLYVRLLAGALALVLGMTAGVAVVNDYYGYYQTWSQASADLSGSYTSFAATPAGDRSGTTATSGRLEKVELPGRQSGINRSGLVYLPPQYFDPRFAHTAFPVLELLHGTPGSPSSWIVHLDVVAVADELMSRHLMGPMVLVLPTMSVGHNYQDCVDAPGALDDTYITRDVRADVEAKFRVTTEPAEWGIGGYSSGGYCAANLAMRHPTDFGASGIMDGYFRPQDGPAAAALHFNAAAEAANNPLLLATQLNRDASPMPTFWVSAGTADPADIKGATAFTTALTGVETVPLIREPKAGHNFYAWQPVLPHMLAWMWTQIAPPGLRVEFPVAGSVQNLTISPPKTILAAQAWEAAQKKKKKIQPPPASGVSPSPAP